MKSILLLKALVILLAGLMIFMIIQIDWPVSGPEDTSSEDLGLQFFGDKDDPAYSPIMLMLALLLIVALLGAVFLAKDEEEGRR